MMNRFRLTLLLVSSLATLTSGACSNDTSSISEEIKQNPPTTSVAELKAWLAEGYYKEWSCETGAHPFRDPSVHGMNRICSNAVNSSHGIGEFPVGAAGVKELYDDTGKTITGYAVYRKLKAGGGESFYWYESVPLDSAAPHDANGIVAAGTGNTGPAKDICVGCHMGAGSDAKHSGHDFVYTQVK